MTGACRRGAPPRRSARLAAWLVVALAVAAAEGGAQPPERIVVDELGRLPAFSHAAIVGDLVFTAGTLGTRAGTIELVAGGIRAETRQTLDNVARILEHAGSDLDHVAKCTVFLVDMSEFAAMNEVWIERFGERPPARTTVGVRELALGARVEVECVAARRRDDS